MAETPSKGEAPFEVLGRIEVDLDALRKSLSAAEGEVKAHGDRMGRIWSDAGKKLSRPLPGGGFGAGEPGGEGPGGGGGEGGGRSPTAEFAHAARIIRHALIPALAQLSPGLGSFISAGAQSARTAVFFGGTVGAAAIAAATLSAVIAKYVANAKEASAVTLDASMALKTLDAGRAEAGMRKIIEAIADYNQSTDILAGRQQAGFWQKVVAAAEVATEKITGTLDTQIKKYRDYLDAQGKIWEKVSLPKIEAREEQAAAAVLGRQAQMDIKTARSVGDLAVGYDKARDAIEQKTAASKKDILADEAKRLAEIKTARETLAYEKQLDAAAKKREEALRALPGPSPFARFKIGGPGEDTDLVNRRAAIEGQYLEEKNRITKGITALDAEEARSRRETKGKIVVAERSGAQDIEESRQAERETLARRDAESEAFVRKDIARNQKRVEGEAATAKAISDSENSVAESRRRHAGEVENLGALQARLNEQRDREVATLRAAAQAASDAYASEKRAAEALIAAGADAIKVRQDLADAEREYASVLEETRRKIQEVEAAARAREEQEEKKREQEEVNRENRRFAHFARMGKLTIQQEAEYQELAAQDPRRSLDEREDAEARAYEIRKRYAQRYFEFQKTVGAHPQEQLDFAKGVLEQAVVGSEEWFKAVQDVKSAYSEVYEAAKKVFDEQRKATEAAKQQRQTEISIAEGEASRRGRKKMSVGEVGDFLALARQRDVEALGGKRVRVGDIGAAFGRQEFWESRAGRGPKKFEMETPEERMRSMFTGGSPGRAPVEDLFLGSEKEQVAAKFSGGLAGAASSLLKFVDAIDEAIGAVKNSAQILPKTWRTPERDPADRFAPRSAPEALTNQLYYERLMADGQR